MLSMGSLLPFAKRYCFLSQNGSGGPVLHPKSLSHKTQNYLLLEDSEFSAGVAVLGMPSLKAGISASGMFE